MTATGRAPALRLALLVGVASAACPAAPPLGSTADGGCLGFCDAGATGGNSDGGDGGRAGDAGDAGPGDAGPSTADAGADAGSGCDGGGSCDAGSPLAVGPCRSSDQCASGSCAPNGFCCAARCDTAAACGAFSCGETDGACRYSGCCRPAPIGSTLYVDSVRGSDEGCCGGAPSNSCQTLSHTLGLLVTAGAPNITVIATVDGGGGDWTPLAAERWPWRIGLGVGLYAPGVRFDRPPDDPGVVFEVTPLVPDDDAGVVIFGGPAVGDGGPDWLSIGFGFGDAGSGATTAIQDGRASDAGPEFGLTLHVGNVRLNGSAVGLRVGPLGTVFVDAPLDIGSPVAGDPLGGIGMQCEGQVSEDRQQGWFATVLEAYDAGPSTLVRILGQTDADIDTGSQCNLSLSHQFILGPEGDCATARGDPVGVRTRGMGFIALTNGSVRCMAVAGLLLTCHEFGQEVALEQVDIDHSGCAGIWMIGASQTELTYSSIRNGPLALVTQDGPAGASPVLDFIGGSVSCSAPHQATPACPFRGGIDLLDLSAFGAVSADGTAFDHRVTFENDAGVDIWSCTDTTLTSCTCQGVFCPLPGPAPLPSEATAVALSSNAQIGGAFTVNYPNPGAQCLP